MKYYHGSPNGNLTKLTTDKANHGGIYFAQDYCFAVMYGGNGIRFWAVDKPTGKLIVREVAENALETLYNNKPCYVYSVDQKDLGEFESADYNGRKSVIVTHDVELKEKEYIPNVLEKLLELEKDNNLIIRRWTDLTKEEQESERNNIVKKFASSMQIEHDKFPEEYEDLTTLFPELKLENLNKQ